MLDGHLYCVPVNIHAWQWLWLSNKAFENAGVPVPTNWDEFVAAGAGAARRPAIQPLAVGAAGLAAGRRSSTSCCSAIGGKDLYLKVYDEKDADVAGRAGDGEGLGRRPTTPASSAKGSNVQDWNQATNMVITGKAGGQIMGDWAQGEFQVAGQVAGKDYTCLLGLGVPDPYITTDGDCLLLPEARRSGEVEGAGGARLGDAVAGDPGRLQPQEGLDAGARRRRPRRRQRLHEEGPRGPEGRATSSRAPTS